MSLFLITFLVMVIAVAAMAVGVWLNNGREIQGSCGGLQKLDGAECAICGSTTPCEEAQEEAGRKPRPAETLG